LGYDLSQARLQEEAHALGIDKKITAMNQAEKSMIRYHAIMSQVTVVQGDMSRTLESPANQVRILKAQFTQLTRAIGNVFIPLLNKLIPYLIAFAQVAREAAESLAELFGFTLPEVDYSSINDSIGDISAEIEDAENSAKATEQDKSGAEDVNEDNVDYKSLYEQKCAELEKVQQSNVHQNQPKPEKQTTLDDIVRSFM
jgi:hypothetical protein